MRRRRRPIDPLAEQVAPEVLNAHGVKATCFVVTAMLDNRALMWRYKLSAIQALRPEETYVPANYRLIPRRWQRRI